MDSHAWSIRARELTPSAPALSNCWKMVLRAIDCGWLDQVETAIVCEALSRREDYTLEELRFDFIDEQLRVAFIDDVACCDPGALLALLRRLRCA